MLRYVFDTDHLTLFQHGHLPVARRLASQPADAVGISVVTIEESIRGRLAQLACANDGAARIRQGLVRSCAGLSNSLRTRHGHHTNPKRKRGSELRSLRSRVCPVGRPGLNHARNLSRRGGSLHLTALVRTAARHSMASARFLVTPN